MKKRLGGVLAGKKNEENQTPVGQRAMDENMCTQTWETFFDEIKKSIAARQ